MSLAHDKSGNKKSNQHGRNPAAWLTVLGAQIHLKLL